MGSLLKEDDSCNLIHMTKLEVFNKERHIRNTGLICTIGPASRQVRVPYISGQCLGMISINHNRTVLNYFVIEHHSHHLLLVDLIINTGPSKQVPVLKSLIEAGLNIARMNFSHGTHDYHSSTIANVRQAAEEARPFGNKRPVGIALDTKGPEIRTGNLKGAGEGYKEVLLKAGQEILVSCNKDHYAECSDQLIYVDYTNIVNIMEVRFKRWICLLLI